MTDKHSMFRTMWQPGRRLLATAGVLLILTALAHTAGQFGPPSGSAELQLVAEMERFRIPLGLGMSPSMLGIYQALAFTMSVTFLALGAINLVLAGSPDTTARLIRRIVWVNFVWVAAFLAVSAVYRIPPPLISAAIIELPLLAALLHEKFTPPGMN